MRASLVLALAMVLCLGCAAESSSFIDASSGHASGGDSGSTGGAGGGHSGSTGGASGGNSGSTGGASGGNSGSTGGASGGNSGSTGGASGGHSGSTGGASGGTAGNGSGGASGGTAGHGSGGGAGHASGGTAGTGSAGAAGHATGGAPGTGGTTGTGGATSTGGSGGAGQAGNPNGSCSAGVPSSDQPADVSNATVIGSGTAASCTFAALNTAVSNGGAITFNCGSAPATIAITATMNLPTNKNTVIDGGNKVTLDGGHAVQILNFNHGDYKVNTFGLTLQHLTLVNGKTTPAQPIPPAPAPCSQGYDDGEGGALYMRDGNLLVVDCIFTGNQAAQVGPDTGGGALYVLGSKNGVVIVGSTFTNNSASNGGAVGVLQSQLTIYNSLFQNNMASGNGANSDDATRCSVINNGQNEVGSGGNGGAICADGVSFDVTLCGDAVLNNAAGANAFGGGFFFTSDDMMGVLTITDTTMTGNTGGYWTMVSTGSVTNVGTAIGVNAKSITVSNSTLQGM
jgi:hypothetical protein